MKIYVKIDNNWLLVEACPNPIQDWEEITITKEQYELIQKQYDIVIENWKIISQEKWQNATDLENVIVEPVAE